MSHRRDQRLALRLARNGAPEPTDRDADRDLEAVIAELPGPSALDRLQAIFELTAFERALIVLCAGLELLSGGRTSTFGAGELYVDKQGYVFRITNGSGHYLPSVENFHRARRLMYERGILNPARPMVLLYR